MIFIRSILDMKEFTPNRRVLVESLKEYQIEVKKEFDNPIVQLLDFCAMLDAIRGKTEGFLFNKTKWRNMV